MSLDQLCNHKIINKTIKGAFTYYITTEWEGVFKILVHDYDGGGGSGEGDGLVMT